MCHFEEKWPHVTPGRKVKACWRWNKVALQEVDDDLSVKLEAIIARLGYDQGTGLMRASEPYKGTTRRHIVRQAFQIIGAHAVFGFGSPGQMPALGFTPVLYLCTARDSLDAKHIHRLVWSQGVVPLLLIATPDALEIRRGLAPPPDRPHSVPWDKLESGADLPTELASLTAVALRSSIVWRDFTVDRSCRVDKALLQGIVGLSHSLHTEQPKLDRSTIHAAIGRFLYLYILLDRGIIKPSWIGEITSDGQSPSCPTIHKSLTTDGGGLVEWPESEVWALFDAIDNVMNGAIFPISRDQRGTLSTRSLHLIHRVIRHGDRVSPGAHQLSFLDISFATLRTETISAIYELFLALESDNTKSDDGAFYTPPFLVDYVLDEIDRVAPFGRSSRVIDPAAGSGVFLVGAFRRIIERVLPFDRWTSRQFQSARGLLEKNVFGIERNPQAANVCRFSLYLTLLDYSSHNDVSSLARLAKGSRVFPSLSGNILVKDVFSFDGEVPGALGKFTHVVGNPPWGSFGNSASRTNVRRSDEDREQVEASMSAAAEFSHSIDSAVYPVSNKRLSELFVWKIKRDLLAPDGVLGILISTRSLVSRSASAFPDALASQFSLIGIANLSHFRYRLFSEARSPTVAIFARNSAPDLMDPVWTYSPLLSSQPVGQQGHLWTIIADSGDIEHHRLRDLLRTPDAWFNILMLRPMDRRIALRVKAVSTSRSLSIGDFMRVTGLRMSRGGSPAQTGLPERLLLKAGSLAELGLEGLGFSSYPHEELSQHEIKPSFQRLFSGNVLLVSRSMNDIQFVERPIGFSSTFNAIQFEPGKVDAAGQSLLKALARYLSSDVARYFYAITGKSWLLDRARLEKNDLEAIPFPAAMPDHDFLAALLSGDEAEITRKVADRMGFDDFFCQSVHEYSEFRCGFEDAQLPERSLFPPTEEVVDKYRRMFAKSLSEALGGRAELDVQTGLAVDLEHFGYMSVRLEIAGGKREAKTTDMPLPGWAIPVTFTPHSKITYETATNTIMLTKPWTCAAWTLERAFSDARNATAVLLQSGSRA